MEELVEILYGNYLKDFDLVEAKKKEEKENETIHLKFREKENRVPRKGLIQNGYCRSIEVIDTPAGGCATYLHFYRRRWSDPVDQQNHVNRYENLRIEGTKITPKFGVFLKGKDRREIDEFLLLFPLLRLEVEKALAVV
jgi:hypothetical protein